jgi:hypothetical protein
MISKNKLLILEITLDEKIRCEKIVKEYLDPLCKKPVKRTKRIKIFENFSKIEKKLFKEAEEIVSRNEKNEMKSNDFSKVNFYNFFANL